MSETLQLPEWSDRITVRHGHRAEVIMQRRRTLARRMRRTRRAAYNINLSR